MKKIEVKSYIQKVKKNHNLNIVDYYMEKDYILSLFLSNWKKEKTPNLDKLIFKGGTLLTKNYLKYHRISEDLDFTHEDSNEIRKIKTKGKQETQIKNKIKLILDEVKSISDLSNLDFEVDRKNSRYIITRNSRKLYLFKLYYKSIFTNLESFIKFEISFVENLIHKPQKEEIKNMVDYYHLSIVDLKLINYNLKNPVLQVYGIEEIILEKLRASITRIQFKPRDIFDLYLINKTNIVFEQNNTKIFKKLMSSPFQLEDTIKNIKNFISEEIEIDLDEIYNLSLIEFNENDFFDFSNKLTLYLKEIALKFVIENDK